RMRAVPGVASAAFGNCPPASGGCSRTSILFDRTSKFSARDPLVGVYWASPEYFSTLGIRLVRGGLFDDNDRGGRPGVGVSRSPPPRRGLLGIPGVLLDARHSAGPRAPVRRTRSGGPARRGADQ